MIMMMIIAIIIIIIIQVIIIIIIIIIIIVSQNQIFLTLCMHHIVHVYFRLHRQYKAFV